MDAVASKHRKGRYNMVTEMYETDSLRNDVPQVAYVYVFHRMTRELYDRLTSHARQRFPGFEETQLKSAAHVQALFRGHIPGFWDNTPRCTVCQGLVENTDAAWKRHSGRIYGELTLSTTVVHYGQKGQLALIMTMPSYGLAPPSPLGPS